MTYLIDEKQKTAAFRQKKLLFWSWFAILVVGVLVTVGMIIAALLRVEINHDRSLTYPLVVPAGLILVAVCFYTLFFFSIKYRLTRRYVAMLKEMDSGLTDEFDGTFLGYDDEIGMKDGVYFYGMKLKVRPLRRDDIDERRLLVEQTVPKIPFEVGTKIRFISHANILMAYEVIEEPNKAEQPVDAKEEISE